MITDKDKFFTKLTQTGEKAVRENLAQKIYGTNKIALVQEWLNQLESSRSEEVLERKEHREEEGLSIAREALRQAKVSKIIAIVAIIASIISAIISALIKVGK
jgi:hypothetical protein